jgi:serine/threonine protein kinase
MSWLANNILHPASFLASALNVRK